LTTGSLSPRPTRTSGYSAYGAFPRQGSNTATALQKRQHQPSQRFGLAGGCRTPYQEPFRSMRTRHSMPGCREQSMARGGACRRGQTLQVTIQRKARHEFCPPQPCSSEPLSTELRCHRSLKGYGFAKIGSVVVLLGFPTPVRRTRLIGTM